MAMPTAEDRRQFREDWDAGRKAALANLDRDVAASQFSRDESDDPHRLLGFRHGYNHGLQEALQARFGDPPD